MANECGLGEVLQQSELIKADGSVHIGFFLLCTPLVWCIEYRLPVPGTGINNQVPVRSYVRRTGTRVNPVSSFVFCRPIERSTKTRLFLSTYILQTKITLASM